MPDFVVGHYPHHARRAILDAVEDALASFGAPVPGSGDVTVIVRCSPPENGRLVLGDGSFKCPECGGSHFGSWSHKREDGTWVILSRQCHDEYDRGCHGMVAMDPSPSNPIIPQDYIDAKHPLAKYRADVPPDRARGCATKVTP